MNPIPTLKQIADAVLSMIPEARDSATGMFAKNRRPNSTMARRVYCKLAAELTPCTRVEIAAGMGRTHPATVDHHIESSPCDNGFEDRLKGHVISILRGEVDTTPSIRPTIGNDTTHLIRKINSLASRVTTLEEQLAARAAEVG